MAENGNTEERLATAAKAGRILRAAKATGEPGDHAEVLYAEVASAAATILAKHPNGTFTVGQRDAISEIIATSMLMNSESEKSEPSWFAKLWKEFCGKSPLVQISIIGGTVVGLWSIVAGASATWYETPKTLRWLADQMGGAAEIAANEPVVDATADQAVREEIDEQEVPE